MLLAVLALAGCSPQASGSSNKAGAEVGTALAIEGTQAGGVVGTESAKVGRAYSQTMDCEVELKVAK